MYQELNLAIDDKLSTRYGNTLTGKFVTGTQFAVYASRQVTRHTRDQPTENAGIDPVNIYMIQPEFFYDDPMIRSLIAESNATFVTLQAMKRNAPKTEYVHISRTYRSVVRAHLEKLQNAIAKDATDDSMQEMHSKYEQYISVFYSIECIWHLCEILLIDQSPSTMVVPKLLEWVRFHFTASERSATDLLFMGRKANDSEEYWPCVKGIVIQGQLDTARALLKLHPKSETTIFKMCDDVLRSMPKYNIYGGLSVQNFRTQWQYWLSDTQHKLSSQVLSSEPDLEEIVSIVTGNATTWNSYIKKSKCWYEYMLGYLYYTNPTCKQSDLGVLVNSWLDRWCHAHNNATISDSDDNSSNQWELNQLDRIILNLMENNTKQVVFSIQTIADNKWFATHIVDLLYHCGQLQIIGENDVNEGSLVRESLLFDFGSVLMSRSSLWQLGMDYLQYCSKEGIAAIEVMLKRIPIRSEKQALKIIAIARKQGYTDAAREICKVQSKRSFNEHRYGNALEWAIRSQDVSSVNTIADFILKHYVATGNIHCTDVIANAGAKMFISPRLVFLVKYYDFYQYHMKHDFLPAAELLINLIESKITPMYFWPALLIDTIPLLESKDPKIFAKDTATILQHAERYLVPMIQKAKDRLAKYPEEPVSILKHYRIENIEEILNLLRLACARNMSRAIILEHTIRN